jgi:hypothetical protein
MTHKDGKSVRTFRVNGTLACFVEVVGSTEVRSPIDVGGAFTYSHDGD